MFKYVFFCDVEGVPQPRAPVRGAAAQGGRDQGKADSCPTTGSDVLRLDSFSVLVCTRFLHLRSR